MGSITSSILIDDRSSHYDKEIFDGESKYNLVSDARTFRRGIKDAKVVLDDKYEKRKRNQDYMGIDEFFSDSNDDIRDPAVKYYETLTKLNQWVLSNGKGIHTF